MLEAFEMASVAPADECLKGVFVPTRRVMLRGRRISRVMMTSVEPPALLVFDGVGLACEGPAQLDDRHVTARVRMCVADDVGAGIPRCWCSPSTVRLSVDADCTKLHALIKANGKRHRFVAQPGFCGDGFIDYVRGEQCDSAVGGLGCRLPCDDTCQCGSEF